MPIQADDLGLEFFATICLMTVKTLGNFYGYKVSKKQLKKALKLKTYDLNLLGIFLIFLKMPNMPEFPELQCRYQ